MAGSSCRHPTVEWLMWSEVVCLRPQHGLGLALSIPPFWRAGLGQVERTQVGRESTVHRDDGHSRHTTRHRDVDIVDIQRSLWSDIPLSFDPEHQAESNDGLNPPSGRGRGGMVLGTVSAVGRLPWNVILNASTPQQSTHTPTSREAR